MPYSELAATTGSVSGAPAVATAGGTVTNIGFVAPGFVGPGFVGESGWPTAVTGDVVTDRVSALTASTVAIGARIKLDGAWVPDDAIAGPIEIDDSLDTSRKSARFTLAGRAWSVYRTLSTWTRVPVEIWLSDGEPGQTLPERLEFRGWLVPGSRQASGQLEPEVSLQADDTGPYDEWELCHEVEPYAGLTRGEIAAELAADVGITAIRTPGGAIYRKPVFTDQANLFRFLQDFGAPEGWHWRLDPDPAGPGHVLVAYTAEIKEPPQAPDHLWTLDDVDTVTINAPDRPASRYVVRGLGMVLVDEIGEETEVQRVWVSGLGPPQVATHRQLADGTLVETNLPPNDSTALYRQSELETLTTRRGGRDLRQVVREWGWFAPAAARLWTGTAPGGGPVDGYYYAPAYVLEDGSYSAWERQRWAQVGERTTSWIYSAALELLATSTDERRWHRRSRAVRANDDPGTTPTLANTGIGDDDASWSIRGNTNGLTPIEEYGVARTVWTAFRFAPGGWAAGEVSAEEGWHSPRATIDPARPYYVLYGGAAQVHQEAIWEHTAERHVVNHYGAGQLLGVTEWSVGWTAPRGPEAPWDWRDSRSHLDSEAFRQTERKHTQYTRKPDGTIQETTVSTNQAPTSRLIVGRVPLPRFRLSAWTVFRQQPIELLLEDATVEELFGFRREVLVMDHLLDLDEARAVARRRRRDDTSRLVTVQRFETTARPGDTVLLIDPVNGIHHRTLLVDRKRVRDLARPDAPATYILRSPL